MVIPEKIQQILNGNERPKDFLELEKELDIARAKGYTVVDISYEDGIYIREQAKQAIKKMGIDSESIFAYIMTEYRNLPLGRGEELYSLDQIIDEKESQFHEDEYPGIYDRFLQLSSIEGEGSYFYEIATDIVYDTNWGDEECMMNGKLEKKWFSFLNFIEWYYSIGDKDA